MSGDDETQATQTSAPSLPVFDDHTTTPREREPEPTARSVSTTIGPQTMGTLVAELEADRLVARRDDSTDGRRRLISLTAAGKRVLADGRRARQTWLAHAIDLQLDAGEQRTLVDALQLLRKLTAS